MCVIRPLFAAVLLFSSALSADECDAVLQTVKTMRDARAYLRCVARQMQGQAPGHAPEQVPEGVILAWDPVLRGRDGTPSGGFRPVPDGWHICDGSNGTPDLGGRFLMGAPSIGAAGATGGKATIQDSGAHVHSGTTGVTRGPDHSISCAGKCGGGRTAAHSHTFDIAESGRHSHGTNLPPYYGIIYICKTGQTAGAPLLNSSLQESH